MFNGRAEYIQVDTDRETNHKRAFFDRDWRKQDFIFGYPLETGDILKPESLSDMIGAAETLAEGFTFVRIDFYEINGRPKFGEITFYPDGGIKRFVPDCYDEKFGALWP